MASPRWGADPKVTSAQKRTFATASGVLHQRVIQDLAIEWIYGSEGQPELRNPLLVMRAWLRFVDTADLPIASINKAWHKRYSDIQTRTVTEATHVRGSITSAMSASILHLLQLEIRPISPTNRLWHRIEGDATSGDILMDMRCTSNGSKIALPKRCGAASLSMRPTVAYGGAKPR